MKKDPKIFLSHILESIEAIEKNTQEISKKIFFENIMVQDAVIRRIVLRPFNEKAGDYGAGFSLPRP